METQSGARTPLVDPFGRELEEWLRDAPATRTPYVADLVVPPVTGPVRRPVLPSVEAPAAAAPADATPIDTPADASPVVPGPAADAETDTSATATATAPESTPGDERAFRRDRARHVAVCAPSFPEPPERIALRFDDLAVALDPASGRTTIERIDLLEDEVRVRDEDLARLAAWEAVVADVSSAEVEGARAFAREVFADLLADAAREADRRERAAVRRAATSPMSLGAVCPAVPEPHRAVAEPVALELPHDFLPSDTDRSGADRPSDGGTRSRRTVAAAATTVRDATTDAPDVPARPVSGLLSVAPVSPPLAASGRPTPLVQPATGPTVIDREAFAAVLRAHTGESPVVSVSVPAAAPLPVVTVDETPTSADEPTRADAGQEARADATDAARPGWWSRLVARLLHLVGRR
ncbi:hypothetical protein [Curtobacterium aetherium]|uniref:Uncharacterized protein n=1 Tax=Curtobacterium aetherium TaxID=2841594 RepID=A0ACD1E7C1_9MICO|nr:hypothetical protein [Curtobacterium sp. L6-1]QWS34699.1 hypothetical protein KM842_06065 [Curtobacterium sp. L6-1]